MYDGSFTRNTSEAIKSYQKDNSLIVNGIPTEELYERIRRDVVETYSKE
jgi:peptidoglycan hydrolase-like protein with peptidoglycan-binding domain